MQRLSSILVSCVLLSPFAFGCSDEGVGQSEGVEGTSSGDGDGDGDASGDGDGDASGDGDGDASGDGDGDASGGDGDAPTGEPSCSDLSTDAASLQAWLDDGGYLEWIAESGVHDSTGPHFGGVRTFIDDCLDASLAAGEAEHPVGAASVKELYGDGDQVLGYAVMIKVEAGAGDQGWYWYESYNGQVFGDGVGAGICTGCHSAGDDFFLSPYPLQ